MKSKKKTPIRKRDKVLKLVPGAKDDEVRRFLRKHGLHYNSAEEVIADMKEWYEATVLAPRN